MSGWKRRVASSVAILGFWLLPAFVHAAPADDLTALSKHVDVALERLKAGDVATAKSEYLAFDDGWFDIEDGIRAVSRARYRSIEDAMGDAKFALNSNPPDQARALTSLQSLRSDTAMFS